MTQAIQIEGANEQSAVVTSSGELVTAALKYSDPVYFALDSAATAFNFFTPHTSKQVIITGFSLKAARTVSASVDAEVILYEADSFTDTSVSKVLYQDAMLRGERSGFSNTNTKVTHGKWVNAKTSDPTVHITVWGYYINCLDCE
jgi:hypothetical protein